MRRDSLLRCAAALTAILFIAAAAVPARAEDEKVTFGTVGQASANL